MVVEKELNLGLLEVLNSIALYSNPKIKAPHSCKFTFLFSNLLIKYLSTPIQKSLPHTHTHYLFRKTKCLIVIFFNELLATYRVKNNLAKYSEANFRTSTQIKLNSI